MNVQKHYTLMINPVYKRAIISGEAEVTELVYSDNLEDINMQLLFHGFKIIKPQIHGIYEFKIVKDSKHDTIWIDYYALELI